ncbi:hypothetical protein [Pontimicrobium sp. SW4]|uniref:DUF4890 domain-containing protein n=1 Tax=Pontimicrobium sp. SW4 TaxID=3153519 RepID=A0AAU7BUB1_9FLAO
MKRLIVIAIALVSLQGIAQERQREHRKEDRKERPQTLKDLSPEEVATLQTKKMTLYLDLTEAQQKEVYKINLANAKERQSKMEALKKMRENGEKPSKENRYSMMNERLDKQIAQKKQMKSILSKEQFEKLEKSVKHKKTAQRKQHKQRGKQKQRLRKS